MIISRHGLPPWAHNGPDFASTRIVPTGWWRKITSLVEGQGGRWFWNLIRRKIGNGEDTNFWEGSWSGPISLKSRFPRLFHLSTAGKAKVSDMGHWDHGKWKWNIVWRREPRSSEQQHVSELFDILSSVEISANSQDRWEWIRHSHDKFSVKNLYSILENNRQASTENQPTEVFKIIWKSMAPFKAQVHGWRAIKNRLPTYDNLRKRIGSIGADGLCCFCRSEEETCKHMFLECVHVRAIWNAMFSWVGICWVAPTSIELHLHSFASLLGGRKSSKFLSGLWICITWVWWKWRNLVIFEKEKWDLRRITDEIKSRFWSWYQARSVPIENLNFDEWCSSCLGLLYD